MSDGNIFEVEDTIYLQLGERQGSSEAPFVFLETWPDDSCLYCEENLNKFFIPRDWIRELPPNFYCVDLSLDSFSLLDKDTFCELTPTLILSPMQIRTIKNCAIKICGPTRGIVKKFFR